MESNVSKNTNSHNFFKLELDDKKLDISVKNLLKQELLVILDLYQQKFNVQIEQKLLAIVLGKIMISPHKSSQLSRNKIENQWLQAQFKLKFQPIIYACPVGLSLAKSLQQSPQTIMMQIEQILLLNSDNSKLETPWPIHIETVSVGWLNFYLDAQFIATWLKGSFLWSQTNSKIRVGANDHSPLQESEVCFYSLKRTPDELFPVQYIHGRCCSLLLLAAREGLIILSDDSSQIKQPSLISWLDHDQHLWLTQLAEKNLLQQLLIIADSWNDFTDNNYWSKLALSLSQNTAIFLADCRFLGEISQKYPQKAIARLGLISLVQFWLEKILREQLGISATKEI